MKQSEDHMDDLFRKAGDNYPLRTDGADWDKVMARLQTGPESAPVAAREGERQRASRKLWWLLLLLFLPAGWLFSRYETGRGPFTKPASSEAAPSASQAGAVRDDGAPSSQAPASSGTASSQAAHEPAGTVPSATVPSVTAPFAAVFPAGQDAVSTRSGRNTLHANDRYVNAQNGNKSSGNTPTGNASFGSTPNDADGGSAVNNGTPGTVTAPASSPAPAAAPGNDSSATAAAKTAPATAAKTTPDTAAKTAPAKGRKRTSSKAQRGMYAGIVAGPDISTIKWQEIQQPGFSVGLTLGYRFNRSLAIEADALWDHKVYYTDGQYFNKAKTDIPSNLTITSMNGNCSMIELPVDLRWDFVQFRHGGGLFATAGFSSYLMKKESYSYQASWGSVYSEGSKTYLNSGNDFFSIFQLSAGYTFKWDHIGDVRIEPYLKMPLKGVGIGSLPMTSTGIYIGITRPFR